MVVRGRAGEQAARIRQAARLVAVLPSPSRIDPTGGSPYVAERARWIVAQVDRLGGPAYLAELD